MLPIRDSVWKKTSQQTYDDSVLPPILAFKRLINAAWKITREDTSKDEKSNADADESSSETWIEDS